MKPLCVLCAAIFALFLLSACSGSSQTADPPSEPEDMTSAVPEEKKAITPEEGVAILEAQLGTVDEATGNVMSYGYEGTVVLDGVSFYNYRVSWLVDGDHVSYLTNYLVSTDGLVVQEYLPETN